MSKKSSGVVLTGDWRKLNYLAQKLECTKEEMENTVEMKAYDLQKEAIQTILDGDFLTDNSDTTLRRKGKGLLPLMESGVLASEEGIIVEVSQKSSGKSLYLIKGNPDKIHSRTGLTYEDIVVLNEEGTFEIPSRPFLTITYNRMKGNTKDAIIYQLKKFYHR